MAADEVGPARSYEQALDRAVRRAGGVFYTPPELISRVLDLSLEPLLDEVADPLSVTVCDPSCGAGLFLAAAAERIARRAGVPVERALPCLTGIDIDPDAIALAAELLPGARLDVGDGLESHPGAPFDLVIGNPPFLNQLRRATALSGESARAVKALIGTGAAYTDVSALFLARSLQLVRPGGRVGLVQPLSVLAARDAAPVREYVETHGRVTDLWASATPMFRDASVLTCVVAVDRTEPEPTPARSWGPLAAPMLGIPSVDLPGGEGTLGDLGEVTADFRDQYYGLEPFVADGGDGFPLITTGLIEPGRIEWGQRPARFLKQKWDRPTIRDEVLESPLGDWARRRLVPKLLIGTQGKIIEAVVDERGDWLPCVPVVSMTTDRPWHALAVLLAPPVVAHAAASYVGTALSLHAIKLSARQVAALPLPRDEKAWHEAAALARAGDLLACAERMCAAYGVDDPALMAWWRERAGQSVANRTFSSWG